VYLLTRNDGWVRVTTDDEVATERGGCRLDAADSHALLARRGGIARIEVGIAESGLFEG